MTTTQRGSRNARPARVGDRVVVQHGGVRYRGWVSPIHRGKRGVEYVVRTEDRDAGMGHVLNIWATPQGRGRSVIAVRARR